ncbi:unnamed protein product [Periconia digitata]|uniref:Uncharacterized protein n=1 Tax=Periconia digitata TaxID=1303443 RepID=A0A9W4UWI1_9PLEO|nr:unnamed protein product [Periconia digitata]
MKVIKGQGKRRAQVKVNPKTSRHPPQNGHHRHACTSDTPCSLTGTLSPIYRTLTQSFANSSNSTPSSIPFCLIFSNRSPKILSTRSSSSTSATSTFSSTRLTLSPSSVARLRSFSLHRSSFSFLTTSLRAARPLWYALYLCFSNGAISSMYQLVRFTRCWRS